MASPFSPQEQFLVDFHDQFAGATSRAYDAVKVTRGDTCYASSYQSLASLVPDHDAPATVLDLACGDGYLLSLLAARQSSDLLLIGVDMSQGELAAAHARLGAAALLKQGKAQALALSSGSADYVLCHMALMLMDDLETVLGEVHRVLKSGATFAFVVGAQPPPGAVIDNYLARLMALHRQHPGARLCLGDKRMRSPETIEAALASRFKHISIEDMSFQCRYTPRQLWEWFDGMYDLYFFTTEQRDAFRVGFLADLQQLCDADGTLAFADNLRQVSAIAV